MKSTTPAVRPNLARRALLVIVAALAIAVGVTPAAAQQPTPTDDEVNRIAKQLYCPVCENTPLDVCPTEACRQWRDLIRQQLSEGWTETQIKEYFVEQYGARVLSEPPRTGLNWLVYVLPPLLILAGIIVLVRSLRSWRMAGAAGEGPASGAATTSAQGTAPDEYAARLEDELRKRS